MLKIICDNHCETCGKYWSVHYCGCEYTKYTCCVANKEVKVIYDKNGNEEKREVW